MPDFLFSVSRALRYDIVSTRIAIKVVDYFP